MKKKSFICVLLAVCIIFTYSAAAFSYNAKGVCVVEMESGDALIEKNADISFTPASLTKIMTLYILYEKLESGEITKDTIIYASSNAQALSKPSDASNIPLVAGKGYSVDLMIKAMVVPSACAVCTMFAEYVSGSEAQFALLMNEKAAELGLTAYFTDASGLSDYNLITPRSVAKLVRLFIQKYPDILNYTSIKEIMVDGKVYKNTNLLLSDKKYYEGADGFKTGTTSIAGKCLAATAQRDGTRIISVSMGSSTDKNRYADATEALNNGFGRADYLNSTIFSTDIRTFINGTEIPCYYFLGKEKALLLIAEELRGYGFDTTYSAAENTLYISNNSKKIFTPIEREEEKQSGLEKYKIYMKSKPRVILKTMQGDVELKTVYSLNGLCMISVDELAKNYAYLWDNDTRSANITLNIGDV